GSAWPGQRVTHHYPAAPVSGSSPIATRPPRRRLSTLRL
ncbi:MAG: hypothetical protein AVDCRST_MAG70-193, partial [uncultured Thermomicrobiales bacterium]